METVRIKVADIIGADPFPGDEEGKMAYALVKKALDGGKAVELDFTGVGGMLAIFIREVVGRIYMDCEEAFLRGRVRMSKMSDYVGAVVNSAIGSAKWYKRDPVGYKMAMEEILEEEVA